MWRRGLGLAAWAILVLALPAAGFAKDKPAGDLFIPTKVYAAHFTFTADQWAAMEPENEGEFFGGGRGPGGPGGPGGRRGFGPGTFNGPTIFAAGDANKDKKLSKEEFAALGGQWFASWDKDKTGKLNGEKIRDGLNASLTPPPGGPGGFGPRMNLQGAEGKRNGLASAAGVEFDYVRADLDFEGQRLTNVAVRYKGNGTWMQSRGSLKRSMKVDLNEFVPGQKVMGISKLNFHNSVTDASWMNEVLSYRLYRDAGVPASRTAYAKVFVTVPGKHDKEYLGLYSLIENVDDNFAEERFATKKGPIFKPVTPELFNDLGTNWSSYKQTYDPKGGVSKEEQQRVIDFAKLLTRADDAEFAAKLPEFIELEQFARYMAVTVYLSTLDSILGIGQNYYMYLHPKTLRFQFIPWDLDHSFGQFFLVGTQEQRDNLSIHKPWRGEIRFLDRVFKVEAFKKLYLAQLEQFSKTVFEPGRFKQQVDEIAAAIRPAVEQESADKLERFSKAAAGESISPAGFGGGPGGPGGNRMRGPGGPGGPGGGGPPGFGGQVQPIKKFVEARSKSVTDQLSGKAKGSSLDEQAPGGPGGRGFGPGMFLGPAFEEKLDTNKDKDITGEEFAQGLAAWFAGWDKEKTGAITEDQLRDGMNETFAPPGGGFGGPPPGAPGRPGQ